MKKNLKWSMIYLTGTILQMGLVCGIKIFLEKRNIPYPTVCSLLFLIFGGASSAIWGIIIAKKSGKAERYLDILKDYFSVKQPIKLYGLVVMFLLILFGMQIITGKTVDGVMWYTFPVLFVQAILFGGIEEIGWRYTFQPLLEKSIPFEAASLITFLSWGVWHYMYFYITDTISTIRHDTFLIGLLGSCFILGAIYQKSQSLWLCVFYHCLLNVLSQTFIGNDLLMTLFCNGIGIFLAIVLVKREPKTRLDKC